LAESGQERFKKQTIRGKKKGKGRKIGEEGREGGGREERGKERVTCWPQSSAVTPPC
jgi:hypothetical protein